MKAKIRIFLLLSMLIVPFVTVLYQQTKPLEATNDIYSEQQEEIKTIEDMKEQMELPEEKVIDDTSSSLEVNPFFQDNLENHSKWLNIQNVVVPQENNFIMRYTERTFVNNLTNGATLGTRGYRPAVTFNGRMQSSAMINNVGMLNGENVNVRVTVTPDPTADWAGDVYIVVSREAFLRIVMESHQSGKESQFEYAFFNDKGEAISLGTYIQVSNLNRIKLVSISEDYVSQVASIPDATVTWWNSPSTSKLQLLGSNPGGTVGGSVLLLLHPTHSYNFFIRSVNTDGRLVTEHDANPGVPVEVSNAKATDVIQHELVKENDEIAWRFYQDMPFQTLLSNWSLNYVVDTNFLLSESVYSYQGIRVTDESGIDRSAWFDSDLDNTGKLTITAKPGNVNSSAFHLNAYSFSILGKVDYNKSIPYGNLDNNGFFTTKMKVTQNIRGINSPPIEISNSTNFNSRVTLQKYNQHGNLIGEQIIEGTVTHSQKIDIPKIENHRFEFVEDEIDLNNFQFTATNQTIKLFYEEQEFTFDFIGIDGNSTAVVTGYLGTNTDIEIPSEILNYEADWKSPSQVIGIGDNAFTNNYLTGVLIPSSITEIGGRAFYKNNLTSLIIPDTITKIGEFAFAENKLSNVHLGSGLVTLDFYVFGSNELTTIDIPENIERIETMAFHSNNLVTVDIPKGITHIGLRAFENNSLEQVKFSGELNGIGDQVFAFNPLKEILVEENSVAHYQVQLSSAVMNTVTERTILSIAESRYSEDTHLENEVMAGEPISFKAVSRNRLQLNSTSTAVWEDFIPVSQWYKNDYALIGEVNKTFNIKDTEESDSGIYYAVIDGTQLPPISLEVSPLIQPDIPAINPEDGTLELENTNPVIEGLSLRYVSDLDFGITTFSSTGQTLYANEEGGEPIVTVQDMRSTPQRNGWELQVRQNKSFGNGAQLIFNPFIHELNQEALKIRAHNGALTVNTEAQRFAGTTTSENPSGIVTMGMGSNSGNGVSLQIPGGSGVGKYETELVWNLVAGPGQTNDDLSFSFSGTEGNSEAQVINYTGNSREVIIPDEIVNTDAGWTMYAPVTSIGHEAFLRSQLISIKMPNTINSIDTRAFRENELTSISFPNALVSLGDGSLEYNKLTEIILPNSVTSIGGWTFNNNPLTRIEMSNKIQSIGDAAFNLNPLTEIIVESRAEADRLMEILTPDVMIGVTELTTLGTTGQAFYQLNSLNERVWSEIHATKKIDFYQSEKLDSYSLDVIDNSLGFSNNQSTGIYKRATDTVAIYVDEDTDQAVMPTYTITPIVLTTFTDAVWGANGTQLQKGMNIIKDTSEGIIHIRNTSNVTLDGKVTISFDGGIPIPRYILGETTDAEWQKAIAHTHPEVPGFELVGRQTMVTGGIGLIKNSQNPKAILELHDTVVDMHNETSGLEDNPSSIHRLSRGLIQHLRHTVDPTAYMYAWGQHTGYNTGAMQNTVLNPNLEQWGIWHEMGHTYQVNRMNFSDLTEVTVNIYSMRAQNKLGQRSRLEADSVYTRVFRYLESENKSFHGLDFWEKLTMFWQLELAFGDEFYPELHRIYREEKKSLRSDMERQQYFIETVSRVSETNLVPFFEAWGLEISTETINLVKDYATLETDIWYLRDEK